MALIEDLAVDLAAPCVEGRDQRPRGAFGQRRREALEAADREHRQVGRERQPARRGDGAAQAGEAAGPMVDGDHAERPIVELRCLHQVIDQLDQPVGLAAGRR